MCTCSVWNIAINWVTNQIIKPYLKNNEPLGATAKIGDDGSLTVARIIKGGAADRSGLIHINDRIIEVNGVRAKKSNVEVRDF